MSAFGAHADDSDLFDAKVFAETRSSVSFTVSPFFDAPGAFLEALLASFPTPFAGFGPFLAAFALVDTVRAHFAAFGALATLFESLFLGSSSFGDCFFEGFLAFQHHLAKFDHTFSFLGPALLVTFGTDSARTREHFSAGCLRPFAHSRQPHTY